MRTGIFVAIVLLSGAMAGTVYGVANLILVEPYLDRAIEIENQRLFEAGLAEDDSRFRIEFDSYRSWQKGGQIFAGTILGMSLGALFGIVYSLSRKVLLGWHDLQKTFVLAGIMWATIFLIPAIKYPANPPGVGDPDTLMMRTILQLAVMAISGFGAAICYRMYKKTNSKRDGIALYVAIVGFTFAFTPTNVLDTDVSLDLIYGFRIMSIASMGIFWVSIATFLGVLWNRFRPDSSISIPGT